jgi:5' nucleotidase, deoxy (Pyrimidine), cytosolic type C protein (NT5C)
MRIALDCDEVLYSWQRTARYLLRNVYTGDCDGYDLTQPFRQWVVADQVGDEAYRWLFDEGVRYGLFRHGHVITGAMLGVRALKAAGHDLIVVTHRPENAVQDTLAWLDFHFGKEDPYPWSGVSILSGGEPKTSVSFHALVDDSPANVQAAYDADRVGIMFAADWNGHDGQTWETLPGAIELIAPYFETLEV